MSELVTVKITVHRDGSLTSDVQTHDNSWSDVHRGLVAVAQECDRVVKHSKLCPHFPQSKERALTPIHRAQPAQAKAVPVAVVKYQVGGLVVHIVGDVQEGDELFKTPQQAEEAPPDVARDAAPIPDHELVTMYDERPTSDLEMIEFAREVERRHGIGVQPQHITDGSPCWCNPDVAYTDPETGASVIVHRRPQ